MLIEAAGRDSVAGQVNGRLAVETEAARVVHERAHTERLTDVAEDRVDRVLERPRKNDGAEHLRPALIAEVLHLLAVLGAVAGVVEARRGSEAPGVQSGRGGDDLEGRARRIEAVSYTHLRAHETRHDLVCRLLLEK